MLAFTADTRDTLSWFEQTHEVEAVGMGGAVWRLKRLPADGGLADQDAKLMRAIDYCLAVSNRILVEQRQQREDDFGKWHDEDIKTRAKSERTH